MDQFLFSKLFWGIIVVLIGISVISQAVFKINLPIGKIVFGSILIYLGVKMLFGAFGYGKQHTSIFGESTSHIEVLEDAKYDVVFGSQVIDLSNAVGNGNVCTIECNIVFGSAKILLPQNVETQIKTTSVFGSVRTPGNETTFGDSEYIVNTGSGGRINLKVTAVFGSARVFEK